MMGKRKLEYIINYLATVDCICGTTGYLYSYTQRNPATGNECGPYFKVYHRPWMNKVQRLRKICYFGKKPPPMHQLSKEEQYSSLRNGLH